MRKIYHHFTKIAHQYRDLRTTDIEPIVYVKKKLKNLSEIMAADVGCGAGRYNLELFEHLGKRLYLYCIDTNENMLKQLSSYLKSHDIKKFQTMKAFARKLPLSDNSLDSIFTFNAVHHFKMSGFFNEVSRILKKGGYLFIYTRLRSQNKRNIWGKYFPFFNQKETRLYELNELKEILKNSSQLKIESMQFFKYKRISTLSRLISLAKNQHYSTFFLYTNKEFKQALERFEQNIKHHFEDLKNITWFDENVLLVVGKV